MLKMAVNYDILNYTINALADALMKKYQSNYESAMSLVLSSNLYVRLSCDEHLLEEGDIYLFHLLEEELQGFGLLPV